MIAYEQECGEDDNSWFHGVCFDSSQTYLPEEAVKNGNNYSGEVKHFSFWNCDVPNNFVNLKLTLKNQNQDFLAGYRVVLRNTQNDSEASGYTDSLGIVTGAVPPAVQIEMTIYNKCNTLLHTQLIGPFAAATDLGVITITTPAPASITVSGMVVACNQSPVTNGFVDLILEGIGYRTAINNGNYSITIQRCSNAAANLSVIATDADSSQQGTAPDISVTSGNYTANLSACGTSTLQFITYTIGGTTFNFAPPLDSLTARRRNTDTRIEAFQILFDSTTYQYTSFNFAGAAAQGTYNMSTGSFIVSKGVPSTIQYNMEGAISITITEYGNFGQYVSGSFSGNFRNFFTNAVVPGTGSFRIRR